MPMFKKSLIALIIIATAVLGGTIYGSVTSDEVTKLDNATKSNATAAIDESETEAKIIYVYVTGAVNNPGMIEIKSNKDKIRADEAIKACGGFLPTADVDNFNLAEEITDGQHIRVPEKIVERTVENQSAGYTANRQDTYTNQNANLKPSNANSAGIVNINTAGLEELQTLNGIGPKMAERIIEYRQINGAFKSIEEIQNVKGIGPKKFEKMKDHIRI